MKTVFSNSMVAHVWAQRDQDRGRNHNGSFYFEWGTIYSYGPHFPIATIVVTPKAQRFVAFNTDKYSPTTSQHQMLARDAVRGMRTIDLDDISCFIHIPQGDSPSDESLGRLADELRRRYTTLLLKAGRARTNKKIHLEDARQIIEDSHFLADQYSYLGMAIDRPADMDAEIEEAARREAEYEEVRAKRKEEKREKEAERQRQQFDAWRRGESVPFPWPYAPPDGSALLTVCGDEVISSRGARIPVDHAKRAWKWIRLFYSQLDEHGINYVNVINYRLSSESLRVGHFTINQIESDGTIHAGCHKVRRKEIERITGVLGLEPVESIDEG